MLYFLYEWLSRGGHEHVPVLNLLKYLTCLLYTSPSPRD